MLASYSALSVFRTRLSWTRGQEGNLNGALSGIKENARVALARALHLFPVLSTELIRGAPRLLQAQSLRLCLRIIFHRAKSRLCAIVLRFPSLPGDQENRNITTLGSSNKQAGTISFSLKKWQNFAALQILLFAMTFLSYCYLGPGGGRRAPIFSGCKSAQLPWFQGSYTLSLRAWPWYSNCSQALLSYLNFWNKSLP